MNIPIKIFTINYVRIEKIQTLNFLINDKLLE